LIRRKDVGPTNNATGRALRSAEQQGRVTRQTIRALLRTEQAGKAAAMLTDASKPRLWHGNQSPADACPPYFFIPYSLSI
jgi:hypothetical protein